MPLRRRAPPVCSIRNSSALGYRSVALSAGRSLSRSRRLEFWPPVWQTVTLFNPVVYLVSGFRWSFFEVADVHVAASLAATAVFLAACLAAVWWIFKTGYRLKS